MANKTKQTPRSRRGGPKNNIPARAQDLDALVDVVNNLGAPAPAADTSIVIDDAGTVLTGVAVASVLANIQAEGPNFVAKVSAFGTLTAIFNGIAPYNVSMSKDEFTWTTPSTDLKASILSFDENEVGQTPFFIKITDSTPVTPLETTLQLFAIITDHDGIGSPP